LSPGGIKHAAFRRIVVILGARALSRLPAAGGEQTAQEVAPDTLEYQTTQDGKRRTWRAKYRADGAGSYERVGDPKDITDEAKVKGQ
jgi:hypothetical protein